jgi:hypothetical protein
MSTIPGARSWYLYERKSYYGISERPSGVQIAQCGNLNHAQRIVQCVNSHDALMDALRSLVIDGERQMDDDQGQSFVEVSKADIRAARAALTSATEGKKL